MISLKQVARSIVIGSATIAAITLCVHAGSIPSGTYGTEFPYHGNIVEVKNTKNGQIFTTTGADYQTSKLSRSEAKFKLIRKRDMRGTGIHAGWVSTRFTKIQYR